MSTAVRLQQVDTALSAFTTALAHARPSAEAMLAKGPSGSPFEIIAGRRLPTVSRADAERAVAALATVEGEWAAVRNAAEDVFAAVRELAHEGTGSDADSRLANELRPLLERDIMEVAADPFGNAGMETSEHRFLHRPTAGHPFSSFGTKPQSPLAWLHDAVEEQLSGAPARTVPYHWLHGGPVGRDDVLPRQNGPFTARQLRRLQKALRATMGQRLAAAERVADLTTGPLATAREAAERQLTLTQILRSGVASTEADASERLTRWREALQSLEQTAAADAMPAG